MDDRIFYLEQVCDKGTGAIGIDLLRNCILVKLNPGPNEATMCLNFEYKDLTNLSRLFSCAAHLKDIFESFVLDTQRKVK